ncbi:TIGR03915 family putative DNA repair protein [Niabella pedocola]|uniref:TIGR03915 family putative DNA repair protein n=1 Tax=Niabella pedocola TaxID=1752077 RepID=A0ABS8PLG3_9BACT|nr:TIGR03915 family putative DNA repair protein [Niabella pedocola]MCD2421705.1 TIGR03915 family putative DNA repair protein [Niabella pedocola]
MPHLITHHSVVQYLFDGSFSGLLTAVFESYAARHCHVALFEQDKARNNFFDPVVIITTTPEKALRVWKGLKKKLTTALQVEYYSAFLAEDAAVMQQLFNYARFVFDHAAGAAANYGHPAVMAVQQMAQKVSRERHRMKAFVRFQKTACGLYIAAIEPDYNVLPLVRKHFKDRYADQRWLIYDRKRKYGIYYDLHAIHEVLIEAAAAGTVVHAAEMMLDASEALYSTLWKDYFKSTNIQERKNTRLHIRHVPRRYWRHLTEKQLG